MADFANIISRLQDPLDNSNISFLYAEDGRRTISNKLKFWDIVHGSFVSPKIHE